VAHESRVLMLDVQAIVEVRMTANTRAEQSIRRKRKYMIITTAHVGPVLAILFGILILTFPRFLNYFVAIWLILHGLLALGVVR